MCVCTTVSESELEAIVKAGQTLMLPPEVRTHVHLNYARTDLSISTVTLVYNRTCHFVFNYLVLLEISFKYVFWRIIHVFDLAFLLLW